MSSSHQFREGTRAALAALIAPDLEPINPLDAWGTGSAAEDIYAECLLALDADPATGLTLFAVDLYPVEDDSPDAYPPARRLRAGAAAQPSPHSSSTPVRRRVTRRPCSCGRWVFRC